MGKSKFKIADIDFKINDLNQMENIIEDTDRIRLPRASSHESVELVRDFDHMDLAFIQDKYKSLSWTRVYSLQQQYANVEVTWPLGDDVIEHEQRAL